MTDTADRQLSPPVPAAAAADTARCELEAKAKLIAELTQYWSSWTLDQALTLDSQERYPCDLLRVFVEYAEGLWNARAASSLDSATSFEAYVESIEHSIVQEILNQLLPDESLIIPEPEAMDVRCIETQENVAKRHLWGRIIRFDDGIFEYHDCISSPTIKEQPFCRDAQNRIIGMAENPSGGWEEFVALTHRPFDAPGSGPKQWTNACHPFQLTLRRFESRTRFKEAIQAHLALRIPDWSVQFLKMTKARGTAVESDVPLATETLQSCVVPENPRKYVQRRLRGLKRGWKHVEAKLELSPRQVGNVKLDLEKGVLLDTRVEDLAKALKIKPEELLDKLDRFNTWMAAKAVTILAAKSCPPK